MNLKRNHFKGALCASFLMFFLLFIAIYGEQESQLENLLPEFESWVIAESVQIYHPENLFEYINGAAESYISYEFNELIVAEYKMENKNCDLVLEIYDMGNEKNSFGIYSSERYPDSHFISVGTQGYLEQGTLNFLAGKYYVKLMSFGCGEKTDDFLKDFSNKISEKVPGEHCFPAEIEIFPEQGLIANSERFILNNFLGYDFLHSGYTAEYRIGEGEFICFLIVGTDEENAEQMIGKYIEAKKDQEIRDTPSGFHIKDAYYENIFLVRQGRYVCGVMGIKDPFIDKGQEYLVRMIENLGEINPVFP